MTNILFTFNGVETLIQCKIEEKMKDIFKRFCNKIQFDINSLFFLYNGGKINENLTFNELANKLDKQYGKMNILVYKQGTTISNVNEGNVKSKEIICPKCNENCFIKFQDYKILLFGCRNNHNNYILLDEFEKSQYINESNIICNRCNNNKFKSYNKIFFKCLTCAKNLCPLCSSLHDRSHDIIDYNLKNYICNIHNDSYISYCEKCKKNLCMFCEKKHDNNHKKIEYKNIIESRNNIKEEIKNFKNKIYIFINNIKEIIEKLNNVIKNITIYYKINYVIINNYDTKKKNYEIIKNVYEIKNNVKLNIIDDIINESDIKIKFEKIINIYNKMN